MNVLRPRLLLALTAALALPGMAAALDGPKVVIEYSMKASDGGYAGRNITETRLSLGNMRVVVDETTPETLGYKVLRADPMRFTIEYTANEKGEIIAGPVELTEYEFHQVFWTKVSRGHVTLDGEPNASGASIATEERGVLFAKGTGTLTLDGTCGELPNTSFITWDAQSFRSVSDCQDLDLVIPNGGGPTEHCYSTCLSGGGAGGDTLCSLAAPAGGWPRLEPLEPKPEYSDLPLMRVLTDKQFADVVHGDNCTLLEPIPDPPTTYIEDEFGNPILDPKTQEPIPTLQAGNYDPAFEELDDRKENEDDQATTYVSWYAAETSRTVPEPGASLLAFAALAIVGGLRRRGR